MAETQKRNTNMIPGKLPPVGKSNNIVRNSVVAIIAIVLLSFFFFKYSLPIQNGNSVSISTLIHDAKAGNITSIVRNGDTVTATLKENKGYEYASVNAATNFPQLLMDNGIKLDGSKLTYTEQDNNAPDFTSIASIVLTLIILVGTIMFIKQMRQAGGGMFSMGETRAKLFIGKRQNITFDSVAGADEAKQELQEVVQFLKNPKKFTSLGARIPKGVLLVGAPGTGKTLLAKAIAGEAGVPFFSTSGSEFEEMLVGAGASRVRDLFGKARKAAPCIVFIDEIDAIGRRRGTVLGSNHTEQTLNQILVEMDGFDTSTNVIIIAATNRPDVLDPALLRPGRFDRTVTLDIPDLEGRKSILAIHSKNKPLEPHLSLEKIAKRTVGFSGADLENMLNEAAILTAKENKTQIGEVELEEAATKVVMGPAKHRIISEEERKTVAYHEAGHALVSKFLPNSNPVHRISIIPRGMSGGVTMYLPEKESGLETKGKMLSSITGMMGGYAAEKLVFGDVTNGASNDIKKATQLAKKMIMEYGMSDDLGPVLYGDVTDFDYNVGGYAEPEKAYSESTLYKIDQEVQNLLTSAYSNASDILTRFREKLDLIVDVLLKQEVIEGAEFDRMMSDVVK